MSVSRIGGRVGSVQETGRRLAVRRLGWETGWLPVGDRLGYCAAGEGEVDGADGEVGEVCCHKNVDGCFRRWGR